MNRYADDLPEKYPKVTKQYKLLEHFNKYIIPDVSVVLRGVEDWRFRMQLARLRHMCSIGDYKESLGIAYHCCEFTNMREGMIFPDADHDWSSLTASEIKIGGWVICKIRDKYGNIISQYFREKDEFGIQQVLV